MQKENYLLELARYIVLNPVRAAMVRTARDWPWSSYRANADSDDTPEWLNVHWILSAFDRKRGPAKLAYRRFVSEGRGQSSPWNGLKQQIYLGTDTFVETMIANVKDHADLDEIPVAQRRPVPKALEYYEQSGTNRDEAIRMAYRSGGHSLKEIGRHFALHYSTISRIVRARNDARRKT